MTKMALRKWLLGAHAPRATFKGGDPEEKIAARVRKKIPFLGEEETRPSIWKLAYADFMTALMTFFLVMWLVNTSAKHKLLGVVHYFNPVPASDRSPFSHGVHDPLRGITGNGMASTEWLDTVNAKHSGRLAGTPEDPEEEKLIQNPFPVLSTLAVQAETALTATRATSPDKLTGDATTRDPFFVEYFLNPLRKWLSGVWGDDQALNNGPTDLPPADSKTAAEDGLANAAAPPLPGAETDAAQGQKRANAKTGPQSVERQKQLENAKRAARLEKELTRLTESLPQSFRPDVTVQAVSEGILICLTDNVSFNMFKISSAVPSPQLVYFLGRMGGIVSQYPGGIIVRGHTDARPYAGDPHGNWRLSANRATMTYYMLLRGKIGDARFLALNGYADRLLKNKANPLARENRRIELLIRFPEES